MEEIFVALESFQGDLQFINPYCTDNEQEFDEIKKHV